MPLGSLFPEDVPEETDANYAQSSLSELFAEEPVPLGVFIQDKKFLGAPSPSPIQYDLIQHAERIYLPDLYPRLAQEFHPYWQKPVRMVNFLQCCWGKGSCHPSTPVYDARTGQWPTLGELQATEVAGAYPDKGKIGKYEAVGSFKEGRGHLFKVTTKKGLETIVWEGHRFLTWQRREFTTGRKISDFNAARGAEWVRLWDLKVGDPVAVSTTVPEPTETIEVDSREVELVGLWIGDGCMPMNRADKNPSLAVGNKFPMVADRYIEICKSYGCEVTVHHDSKQNKRTLSATYGRKRNIKNPVREICFERGLVGKRAANKRIPKEFFSLPTHQVALLISRLIDTDGWVCLSNTAEIGYGTISKGLAEDIHKLLLRLDVLAEIKEKHTKYKGEPYISYQVRVRNALMVDKLASQLTLLDKWVKLLEVHGYAKMVLREGKRTELYGDLFWDRIASIEYFGEDDYWTTTVEGPASYVTGGGILAHNSGKDMTVRLCQLRAIYLLHCLNSPLKYFGMPDTDWINLINVAMSAEQAESAFFRPLVQAVKTSPWFRDKVDPMKTSIKFPEKNIESKSGHSDTESQEGGNLIMAVADEIDAFKTRDQLMAGARSAREPTNSAEGILRMLRSSGFSRFPQVTKQIRISYPRYKGSTIQKLIAQSQKHVKEKGEASNHYFSGPFPTWEVNPLRTRADFDSEFEEDPVLAEAMYGCNPSYSSSPFMTNEQALQEAFVHSDLPPLAVFYTPYKHSYSASFEFSEDLVPMAGAIYAVHADLAITGDRAGIAMSHVMSYEEHKELALDSTGGEHIKREFLPRVKTDFATAFEADATASPPREIQIRWVRELCFELQRRGFVLGHVSYDGYQSTDSIQLLNQAGIQSSRVSVDLKPDIYLNLRDLVASGRTSMPFSPLLEKELLGLTRKTNGKVDHGPTGSKDVSDAVAASQHVAITLGGSETGERAYYGDSASFATGSPIMMPHQFKSLTLDDVMTSADPFTEYNTFPMSYDDI